MAKSKRFLNDGGSSSVNDIIKGLEETTNGKGVARNQMEEWKEVFVGVIPTGKYQTQLSNGENKGLVVELNNDSKKIIINFGIVQAVRMFDEGIVQKEVYADRELDKYKDNEFANVIYEVTGGEFTKQIQNISDGYWETLEAKHYVIITMNYNIDIITENEPEIKVL